MDLNDIVKPIVEVKQQSLNDEIVETISEATTEELHEWLREIRHNRSAETIVVQKKERKKAGMNKVLEQLNPEQLAALMKMLG